MSRKKRMGFRLPDFWLSAYFSAKVAVIYRDGPPKLPPKIGPPKSLPINRINPIFEDPPKNTTKLREKTGFLFTLGPIGSLILRGPAAEVLVKAFCCVRFRILRIRG